MEGLLREQWTHLLNWLRDVDAVVKGDAPSGLRGWSIGDLIAHLGYGIAMLTELEPAPTGARPLSVGQYVGRYRAAANTIHDQTQQLRIRLGSDLLPGIEDKAHSAWRSLEESRPSIVVGRRGPMLLDDYLMTRLIELVVHGDDLARALGDPPSSPVIGPALLAVSEAMASAHFEAHGVRPDNSDPLEWIRQATGRVDPGGATFPVLV